MLRAFAFSPACKIGTHCPVCPTPSLQHPNRTQPWKCWVSKHLHSRDKRLLSNSTAPAAEDDWWPVPEEPTLRPAASGQRFSSRSPTMRGRCWWLGPSCPKVGCSVWSELEHAFNLPKWNFLHTKTSISAHVQLLSELGWRERKNVCPVRSVPGWGWDLSAKQANSPQRDEFADGNLLPEADPCQAWHSPVPSPRGSAGHPAHPLRLPGYLLPGRSLPGVRSLSWTAPTCSSQHLVWPEAGFVPALSKATDKHHTLLFFVVFLGTSARSLFARPRQHWPQTPVKYLLNASRSSFWIVCAFACLGSFTLPGRSLFWKLTPLGNPSLIIKLNLQLVYMLIL